MNINPLPPNLVHLFDNRPISSATSGVPGASGSFADILSESLQNAVHMDQADKSSMLALLSGEADDLSGLLIDIQKAELSLQLALQIRNKVIDAYNEVLRMSV